MNEIDSLRSENEQLKIINENKSDVISITAHQLRTSLSALKWIFKMLIDGDAGKLTNEQNDLVEKAYGSSERMLSLVNDLLTLNHTDDVSISYNFQKIDISILIEQILFEFYGETNKKGVELIFLKSEKQIPLVLCDVEMMRVVIQNLVENSIKYNKQGGKVFVSIKQVNENVQISVHDSGIGIKKEDQENIFKKFFRAQNAVDKENIGSGLGLFTTKNIIEKHNGKIWFDQEQKEGTTFYVSLPIAK